METQRYHTQYCWTCKHHTTWFPRILYYEYSLSRSTEFTVYNVHTSTKKTSDFAFSFAFHWVWNVFTLTFLYLMIYAVDVYSKNRMKTNTNRCRYTTESANVYSLIHRTQRSDFPKQMSLHDDSYHLYIYI